MTTPDGAGTAWLAAGQRVARCATFALMTGALALQAGCGDDTNEPSACVDDAARTVSCGAGGEQAQVCAGGVWVDDGACIEPGSDDCTDGAERTVSCGDGGEQAQVCADGAWVDDGACFEPECDEGEVRELDCGPDTEQAAPPACVSGLWENGGACVCPEDLVYDELARSCAGEVAGCDPDGAPFGGGDGTAGEPFLICSVAQLHAVRARDGEESHYVLAATLDLSDEEGFQSLGALHGSFDGVSRALVGLTLEASPAAGLFASVGAVGDEGAAPGVVRDLVLRGFDVQGGVLAGALAPVVGTSADNVIEAVRVYGSEVTTATASGGGATGGLVGHLMAGTVRDSVVDATVNGHDDTGGLVGRAQGPVVRSFSSAVVTGRQSVGGLVGRSGDDIEDSHATGDVVGSGDDVGGLVGFADGPVLRCSASGAVTGAGVGNGGLVGESRSSVIDSSASGDVIGGDRTGGLVGISTLIREGRATGNVSGGRFTGGLAGTLTSVGGVAIEHSVAYGDVVGGPSAGGLVGGAFVPVRFSTAYGSVQGTRNSGGLAGYSSGRIEDCVAYGSVHGQDNSGGLVGQVAAPGQVTRAQAWGDVVATGTLAGGLVAMSDGHITLSFARGAVSAGEGAAGLVGEMTARYVTDSWCDGPVSAVTGAAAVVYRADWSGQAVRCWSGSTVSVEEDGDAALLVFTVGAAAQLSRVIAIGQGDLPLVFETTGEPPGTLVSGSRAVTLEELAVPETFIFDIVGNAWVMSDAGGITAPDLIDNPRGD